MDKLEKQAAEISRHFEALMIYIVQMQEKSTDELHDVNKQEANVMFFLGERGASIMRELAENLRLHVSTMTGIVDKLIEKGFVVRERSDEDRRIVRVSLTAQGARAYHQEADKRRQLSRIILNSLNEKEREQFLALFSKITTEIEKNIG